MFVLDRRELGAVDAGSIVMAEDIVAALWSTSGLNPSVALVETVVLSSDAWLWILLRRSKGC